MNEDVRDLLQALVSEREECRDLLYEIVHEIEFFGLNEVPRYKPIVAAIRDVAPTSQ